MTPLFVDTAGWMACADASDPAHARCCAARDEALEAGQTLVTTDFVIDETLTLLRFRLGVDAAEAWWQQVDRSPRLRWERVDGDRFEKARQLAREASLVGADFEAHIRDLYLQLSRAYELGGQPEQALAVYAELEGLTQKQS